MLNLVCVMYIIQEATLGLGTYFYFYTSSLFFSLAAQLHLSYTPPPPPHQHIHTVYVHKIQKNNDKKLDSLVIMGNKKDILEEETK